MLSPFTRSHLEVWRKLPPYWSCVVLLCIFIATLWLPSLNASFQFDDWNVIVNDARVQSVTAWLQSMPGIRPLLKLTYALNNSWSHNPSGFRCFNIVVHAINALLVYDLFLHKTLQWRYEPGVARWTGLLTALIFASHPAQTEAITYISGRSSSLSALFSLLSLTAWARHEAANTSRAEVLWLSASCVALIMAAAVKETALAMPLLLWLWSISKPDASIWPKMLWVPALQAIGLLVIVWCLPAYQHLLQFSLKIRPLSDTLFIQAQALLYLSAQLLRIEHMNADPQLNVETQLTPLTAAVVCMWLVVLIASLWRLLKRRHQPSATAFALWWFFICLLPTHSLLARLDLANDRQLYLALLGPAWLLSLHAVRLHAAYPKAIATGCATVLLLLAISTAQRNQVYATEVSFWQTTAAQNPANARAANNLGLAYAMVCQRHAATKEFSRAIALEPQDFHARINLMLLQRDQLPDVPQRCSQK